MVVQLILVIDSLRIGCTTTKKLLGQAKIHTLRTLPRAHRDCHADDHCDHEHRHGPQDKLRQNTLDDVKGGGGTLQTEIHVKGVRFLRNSRL